MDTSDIHLESALEEYNQKVNELESAGVESEKRTSTAATCCV